MTTSLLTLERPEIWRQSLALATSLTRYEYAPKMPLADGTIYACGGGGGRPSLPTVKLGPMCVCGHVRDWHVEGSGCLAGCSCMKNPTSIVTSVCTVAVPAGAMEWLLHEVGHWVAATPAERSLPNYGLSLDEHGHDGDREWQAWAFEEIVLAPFGPSRLFAPPTQRDGAAFSKAGPMPAFALRHVEREIVALGIDVERWRVVYGEWVRWGRSKRNGEKPWERLS